ncbi:hypothetical protein [Paracoccus methylarcula]|uniref:Uncharacterized protein n=1 Tax=Paracoccus methylarcula TaxID=72022 RepID=A0A3R7LGA7_9RHOB|nr:hypothetical protein [Paracoccus methylarcula]RNF32966.1 hypothetical protein A7A09_019325 [Paracoccus methylarcula]
MLARQYSIIETRNLLNASENMGPGTGGHAMATHGHLRVDVTDRNKPNDSAFQKEIRIFGKRLVSPRTGTEPSRPVTPMDQAMVVAFALNSPKGQQKLRQLDAKPNNGQTYGTAIVTEMQGIGNVLPELRIGQSGVQSSGTLPRIKVEIFRINGQLHIHTAYAMA